MKPSKIIFSLALIFSLISCERDRTNSHIVPNSEAYIPNTFSEYFGSEITSHFVGRVIDTNQNPIEDVVVTIGSSIASTDANGVFIINNASIYEQFGYVKASKVGYLNGSRSVVPTAGTNTITIMLLEETIAGTTLSGISETISLSNGASVALEGNYINEDGSDYSGSVNVIMHLLDPTDDNMNDQMPGMLYAENSEGAERMLQTFGMIAAGSFAEITVPLDPSLVATAPSTIPLWYFDEAQGYWIEEGEANLVGNAYVGIVTHFSFWNCDIPAKSVNLCLRLTNLMSNPLANMRVTLTSTIFGTTEGYTNNAGEVCGVIPKDESLEIKLYNSTICDDALLYTWFIGPFANDAELNLEIDDTVDLVSETVTGFFNTCEGDPVNNGYVIMDYGNQTTTSLVTNGYFEFNVAHCASQRTFYLTAYDTDNLTTSGERFYEFSNDMTNVGAFFSCTDVPYYIIYQIDDHPPIAYFTDIYAYNELGNILVARTNPTPEWDFYIYPVRLGQYSYNTNDDYIIIYLLDSNGDYLYTYEMESDIDINIHGTFEMNQDLHVSFSGTYRDADNILHTISGDTRTYLY